MPFVRFVGGLARFCGVRVKPSPEALAERDKIVAWLRRNPGMSRGPDCMTALTLFEAADAIERGDHSKKNNS